MPNKFKKIKPEKPSKIEERKPFFPTISFNDEQLPEVKDWEVGHTYKVALEIKQKSKSIGDEFGEGDSKQTRARFDIIGIKVLDSGMTKEQAKVADEMGVEEDK